MEQVRVGQVVLFLLIFCGNAWFPCFYNTFVYYYLFNAAHALLNLITPS